MWDTDQYDNLSLHTHRGIEFLDKYGQFMKERCVIEQEYASKLKKLVKNHLPKKINEDEYYKLSSCQAFSQMTKEINDLAGQHEMIAEDLTNEIVKEISILVRQLKDERKKYLHDGTKLQNNLQVSIAQLEKAKRTYEKAFKEAEKAQDAYMRADADINLSRAEVEKAKSVSNMKNHLFEESKSDYADHLQKTNVLQKLHYSEYMPNIFQQLQDMEERRIACIQNFMKQSADSHRHVLPIIEKCLDGICEAAESINGKMDSEYVAETYKTGLRPPSDFPFEDLSNLRISERTGNGHTVQHKADTVKGTISGRPKKRGGLFGIFSSNKHNFDECKEDYSDLPPNQRKKKLQQKIDYLNLQIQQQTSSRDALMKMKAVYERNRSLGDPLSVEGQIAENGHTLERLRSELQKFQGYMNEADGKTTPPMQRLHRSSLSEESLSRSASDSSVSNPYVNSTINNRNHVTEVNNVTSHGNSNSPESGIGMSRVSLPDDDDDDDEFDDFGGEFDNEPLAVLGTARALYAFDAQSDGSISIYEGEEFEVVELDQGDGWTRVRKSNLDEGFVPSTYIEVFVYNNC